MAGRIIEKITNQPWYKVVRDRILDPLELSHTFAFPFESVGDQPMAHLFQLQEDETVMDLQGNGIQIEGMFSFISSAGCLFSTPEDLVRFSTQLHGGHILQPETMDEMYTVYSNWENFYYGLGVYWDRSFHVGGWGGIPNWGHSGYYVS